MLITTFVCCIVIQASIATPLNNGTRKNVLMIIVDDLRPEIGDFYDEISQLNPHMYTPNMDALAGKSAIFKNAHCQYALCGPSRTSFLTSRRPHTTSVFDNHENFRAPLSNQNIVTMPQFFKSNGYKTIGIGKVFHGRGQQDYPMSWDEQVFVPPNLKFWRRDVCNYYVTEEEISEKPLPDTQSADQAIKVMKELAPKALTGEEPFFIGLGFYKPHLHFVCPERLLKHYPLDMVTITDNQFAPNNFPTESWTTSANMMKRCRDIKELGGFKGDINETLPADKVKDLRKGYYSCVSHIDEELGRVLKTLKDLELEESTIVTLFGDHGYQLGEHSQWGKRTSFYLSTRAPLIVHIPSITMNTQVVNELVEFVDIMPTLVDAAGLSTVPACPTDSPTDIDLCTEGSSLLPLLTEAGKYVSNLKKVNNIAYTQNLIDNYVTKKKEMQYGVYDERFHFIQMVGNTGEPEYLPVWSDVKNEQLYDAVFDPDENINVADNADYKEIKRKMEILLQKGFPRSQGERSFINPVILLSFTVFAVWNVLISQQLPY